MSNHNSTLQYLELGKFGKAHGVHGELRLFLHNPSSTVLFDIDSIFVRSRSGQMNSCTLERCRDGSKFLIGKLKGVDTPEAVRELVNCRFYVLREQLPPPGDGEFYIADLVGVEVFSEGVSIGRIVTSWDQSGNEILSVANDVRELQIPMINQYVDKLDMDVRRLDVINIEGLPENKL